MPPPPKKKKKKKEKVYNGGMSKMCLSFPQASIEYLQFLPGISWQDAYFYVEFGLKEEHVSRWNENIDISDLDGMALADCCQSRAKWFSVLPLNFLHPSTLKTLALSRVFGNWREITALTVENSHLWRKTKLSEYSLILHNGWVALVSDLIW